jgi:Fe-S cluster biosynthesis and repair protein YggX
MYINVVVVSLDGTKRNETMIINEKDVDFMNLKWEVGISQDHVYLFVTKQKTIFRIRLYSKDNLYT